MSLYDELMIDRNFEMDDLTQVELICNKMNISAEEYNEYVKKFKNHQKRANFDVTTDSKIYSTLDTTQNSTDMFIILLEENLNNNLLEQLITILSEKNFEYDLTKIGVSNYGKVDEQLFIQSLLFQKVYQYMIMNSHKIHNHEFVNDYYLKLINVCTVSKSFDEVLNKCDLILYNSIIESINSHCLNDSSHKDNVLELINDRFISNGYCFHGFNNNFENSILKYGLSGKENCYDVQKLMDFDKILRQHGIIDSFQQNWNYQLQPNFFTTDNFGAAYYYSVLSPVFISRLVSNGKYMINESQYDRTAFLARNIDACINNIEVLLSEYKVSHNEKIQIKEYLQNLLNLLFCEKDTLKVAVIERNNIDRDFSFNYDIGKLIKNELSSRELLSLGLKASFEVDRHQNIIYSPEIISTIEIPNFAKKMIKKRN